MKKKSMHDRVIDRILQTSLALVPACLGLFAFINNITDWEGTVERVVYPLLSMTGNGAESTHGWRAINNPVMADVFYGVVTSLELVVGLLALYGAIIMGRTCNKDLPTFHKGSRLVRRACQLGIIIYCFIFFTIGGDWFLAWKNENLIFLQGDALNYAMVLTIVFLILHLQSREE